MYFKLLALGSIIQMNKAMKRRRSVPIRIAVSSSIPIIDWNEMDGLFDGVHFEIESLDLPTTSPAQPVGKGATRQAAMERVLNVMRHRPNATIWIGVESGMYRKPQGGQSMRDPFSNWFDVGRLVIIYEALDDGKDSLSSGSHATLPVDNLFTAYTRISRIWSAPFPVPESRARNCLNADGSAAKKNGNHKWSVFSDPLRLLTNGIRSRRVWLRHAVKHWILEHFNEIDYTEKGDV